MDPVSVSIPEMYAGTKAEYDAFLAELDRSLGPRPPDVLYEKFAGLGPTRESLVLDAGCRHAVQTCELHRRALTSAGFSVVEADVLGSEWREYGEETDSEVTSKQLLRIARMRRNREELIAKYGEKTVAGELANCHWGVYQVLGKLSPIVYTLVK